MNPSEAVEGLAAVIGEQVYIDIAKWHLYLNDAKLHVPLAEQLYPLIIEGKLTEPAVTAALTAMSIQVGGGKQEIPLIQLIPAQCQMHLMDALEEFARDL
jgi:hypothetical protein